MWMTLICGTLASVGAATPIGLTLARGETTPYTIVLPAEPDALEELAATELRDTVRQMCGAEMPITREGDSPARSHRVLIGNVGELDRLLPDLESASLGDQGFALRTRGRCLVVVGGSPLATLYGVYTLLEEHLGCVWCSSSVTYVPRVRTVQVPPLNEICRPAFRWREVYYHDAMDPTLTRRLRLNGNASETGGGRVTNERHAGWNLWVHTFYALVPPDRYANDHPEYFSLVGGQRRADLQLCLTNPDVLRITIESLRRRMADDPETLYWSVSQNDTGGPCECPQCEAIDEREGTHMGSLLEFVNQIARAFPEKQISTLAYQYTRKPPKTLRPEPNVAIMLCSIECNRSLPIADDPSSASFRDDIVRWSELSDNLQVWDYVVQFSNLVSPFPNLHVLQPDMRFFRNHHVTAMFSQGNRECCGELAELRTYLLAHLQWDPDRDTAALTERFLRAYYGAAAEPIGQYISEMHDALRASGAGLGIFGSPKEHAGGYLSPERLDRYHRLFDEAERLAASNTELIGRVRAAHMPLQYAMLELGHGDVTFRRSVAESLFATAQAVGLRMFNEWNLPTEEYRRRVDELLQ